MAGIPLLIEMKRWMWHCVTLTFFSTIQSRRIISYPARAGFRLRQEAHGPARRGGSHCHQGNTCPVPTGTGRPAHTREGGRVTRWHSLKKTPVDRDASQVSALIIEQRSTVEV